MSEISKNSEAQFILNGNVRNSPLENEDVSITADYEGDEFQPQLTVDSYIFNLQARKDVLAWVDAGTSGGVGIFEAMNLDYRLFNQDSIQKVFHSLIDFTNDFKDFPDDGELSLSIMDRDGLTGFFNQLTGTTYGYLEEIGVFTQADYIDVPYVVEKKFNAFEILMSSVVVFLMTLELAKSIKDAALTVAISSGIIAAGLSGAVGGAIYLVAEALIALAYAAILLIAVIDISTTLFNTLVSPVRHHKGILLKTALTKVANYFGYDFVAPISEYNNVVYLPSNPNLDEKTILGFISVTKGTQSGIPNTLDYGYLTEDMFKLGKDLPYARMGMFGNTIHLRPQNDPFWVQQTQWTPPDILINTLEYNTDEMKSTRLLRFITDLNDEWTVDNYVGTAVEIKTSPVTVINEKAVLLSGLDEVNFNVALGNRKDELNAIEKLLKELGGFIDIVSGVFGGGTNFAQSINAKIGMLKQQTNWHAVPKLLYLNGDGTMPVNHRAVWNADILWEKYHKEKSFVRDNWHGQKKMYNNIEVPFGLEDFLVLLSNPYFPFNGEQAKMDKFVWEPSKDTAVINFYIRKPYTFNLKETKIIPQ